MFFGEKKIEVGIEDIDVQCSELKMKQWINILMMLMNKNEKL